MATIKGQVGGVNDLIERGMVGGFDAASDAFARFITTGKVGLKELTAEFLTMAAKIAAQQALLQLFGLAAGAFAPAGAAPGPIAGPNGMAAQVHTGGTIGDVPATRRVPMALFAGAPRFHAGGWPGLASDEVPAILQRGERVLSRREAAAYGAGNRGGVHVGTIAVDARGASDPAATEAAVRRAVGMALAAVPDEAQRNPAYRAAITGA
jgi:phage-related minor tail protein